MALRCVYPDCSRLKGRRNLYCKKHYVPNITTVQFLLERASFLEKEILYAPFPPVPNSVLVAYTAPIAVLIVPYETTYAAVALYKHGENKVTFLSTEDDRTNDYLYTFGEMYKVITARGIAETYNTFAVYSKDGPEWGDIDSFTIDYWNRLPHLANGSCSVSFRTISHV